MASEKSEHLPLEGDRLEIQKAVSELTAAADDFVSNPQAVSSPLDQAQRRKLIDIAERIQDIVKDSDDQWVDQLQSITVMTANRLFSDWKAFDVIPPEGSISIAELAEKIDAEEALISKVGHSNGTQ